jgi:hypothetical protein
VRCAGKSWPVLPFGCGLSVEFGGRQPKTSGTYPAADPGGWRYNHFTKVLTSVRVDKLHPVAFAADFVRGLSSPTPSVHANGPS